MNLLDKIIQEKRDINAQHLANEAENLRLRRVMIHRAARILRRFGFTPEVEEGTGTIDIKCFLSSVKNAHPTYDTLLVRAFWQDRKSVQPPRLAVLPPMRFSRDGWLTLSGDFKNLPELLRISLKDYSA